VILAAQAVKLGYIWVVEDGKRVHFLEDTWFGTAPLAVQFWKLYSICNEKTETIAEVCVNEEIRLTFRRAFSADMMSRWEDLKFVVEQVVLKDDSDALIWGYNSSGIYSSKSCYVIISNRG
jgi:hypothetical protein